MTYSIEFYNRAVLVEVEVVILHGFIKKTQQTPPKEVKTARKRLKELQHG